MTIQHSSSISTQAKQYNAILTYVHNECDIKNAKTNKQIFEALRDNVRNEMQVRDALRSMHNKGIISRVKVGGSVQYFYAPTKQNEEIKDVQTSAPTPSEPIERRRYPRDTDTPYKSEQFGAQRAPTFNTEKVSEKLGGPVPPAEPVSPPIPEITIIGNTIVIAHPKCKITLEV